MVARLSRREIEEVIAVLSLDLAFMVKQIIIIVTSANGWILPLRK
jgi:hypothetical protein